MGSQSVQGASALARPRAKLTSQDAAAATASPRSRTAADLVRASALREFRDPRVWTPICNPGEITVTLQFRHPLSKLLVFVALTAGLAQAQTRWVIDTVAGSVPGPVGPALDAFLNAPQDVAIDLQGNILVSDDQFHWIRSISPGGMISVFAGTGERSFARDGSEAASSAIGRPRGMAANAQGEVYYYENLALRIRKVDTNGILTTVVGSGRFSTNQVPAGEAATEFPLGFVSFIDLDPNSGVLYVGQDNRIWRVEDGRIFHFAGTGARAFGGDGGPAIDASFSGPIDAAVGPDGSVYVADERNFRIRKIESDGSRVTTVVGTGEFGGRVVPTNTDALMAAIPRVPALAVGPQGRLHYADATDRVYRLEDSGALTLLADLPSLNGEQPAEADKMVFDATGNLIIIDQNQRAVYELSGDGLQFRTLAGGLNLRGDGGPALEARFHDPRDVAFDSVGNLFVADTGNRVIRMISNADQVSTVAGDGSIRFSTDAQGVPAVSVGIGFIAHVVVDASDSPLFPRVRVVKRVNPAGELEDIAGFDPQDTTVLVGAIAQGPDDRVYFVNSLDRTVLRHEADGSRTLIAGNGERGSDGDGGGSTSTERKLPRSTAAPSRFANLDST